MTEEKQKRLIVAVTVGSVLLMVVLLFVMVFQLVALSQERNKHAVLEQKIAEYKTLKEQGEDALEARSARWWIEQSARELGYYFDGDKLYPKN